LASDKLMLTRKRIKLWQVIALTAVAILIGAAVAHHFMRPTLPARPASARLPPSDPAELIIYTLAQDGSDLSQPHTFVFTVKYWHKAANGLTSKVTAKQIQTYGFTVLKEGDPDWSEWKYERRIVCTTVPTKPALQSALRRVRELSRELGGYYEGDWGAYIVKKQVRN